MKIELPLFLKEHADTLIQETKTISEETFEKKSSKPLETFLFNPPIVLHKIFKWL